MSLLEAYLFPRTGTRACPIDTYARDILAAMQELADAIQRLDELKAVAVSNEQQADKVLRTLSKRGRHMHGRWMC